MKDYNVVNKGMLISFEGIDGCGKSTVAKRVADHFSEKIPVILTKEPGGTQFGSMLRTLLQEQPVKLDERAEFFLFAADRAQHISNVILPALQQKKIIFSDRMADSSLVYQGFGLGLDKEMIRIINAWAMQNIEPDLTFYIRVDYQTAYARCALRGERLTAFEKRGVEFTKKLIEGFDYLASTNSRMQLIDGTVALEKVVQEIIARVELYLKETVE